VDDAKVGEVGEVKERPRKEMNGEGGDTLFFLEGKASDVSLSALVNLKPMVALNK